MGTVLLPGASTVCVCYPPTSVARLAIMVPQSLGLITLPNISMSSLRVMLYHKAEEMQAEYD